MAVNLMICNEHFFHYLRDFSKLATSKNVPSICLPAKKNKSVSEYRARVSIRNYRHRFFSRFTLLITVITLIRVCQHFKHNLVLTYREQTTYTFLFPIQKLTLLLGKDYKIEQSAWVWTKNLLFSFSFRQEIMKILSSQMKALRRESTPIKSPQRNTKRAKNSGLFGKVKLVGSKLDRM